MTPFPDRAKALIPMLASDNDGEALNAARALGRSLRSSGLDFHDIVKVLDRPGYPRQQPCAACAMRADEVRARAARATEVGTHTADLAWLLLQDFPFTEREREFLSNLKAWKGELTEKQAGWFGNILAKVKARTGATQ